jgi:hypothetical protein
MSKKVIPSDIIYFAYKDKKDKFDTQLVIFLDYEKRTVINNKRVPASFVGIDLYKLVFISNRYSTKKFFALDFYNQLVKIIRKQKGFDEEKFIEALIENPVMDIITRNEEAKEITKKKKQTITTDFIKKCLKVFHLSRVKSTIKNVSITKLEKFIEEVN